MGWWKNGALNGKSICFQWSKSNDIKITEGIFREGKYLEEELKESMNEKETKLINWEYKEALFNKDLTKV